jgi:multisubunit Na+/H+ antiporter MnhE subunit
MARSEHDERATPRWKAVLLWVIQWVLFFGAWLLFVGKLELAELLVGVAAAALASTGSYVVWATHLARFGAHLSWIAQAWRLPLYMFTGTYEVLEVLVRHLFTRHKAESLLRAVPYEACGPTDDEATMRALAITYTTITPNFVVVAIDREQRVLLFHQVKEGEVLEMTRKLGARP